MRARILNPLKNRSFFLFGARNTGKSTLLRKHFPSEQTLWLDLLDPALEAKFSRDPGLLVAMVKPLSDQVSHVVIDEVQKIPKLLDVIHHLIESTHKNFIMSGSSARKLKHGGANLLAGRAFVYHLYPFSYRELKKDFDLDKALQYGLLPEVFNLETDEERVLFLQSYANTYLKEEVWAEQLVRRLDPFRRFLEVAAQSNGKIINMSNIARDVGVDSKTVKEYFSIVEDTLLGFFLEPFEHSFRKRLSMKPKFYWFDPGVSRVINNLIQVPLQPRTHAYGNAFEHFVILEFIKLSDYYNKEFRFSYLRTKDDVEIDLIVERPGKPLLCVEIKSNEDVTLRDLGSFPSMSQELGAEAICLSRDKYTKEYDNVKVMPWREGLAYCFDIDV